MRERLSRIAPAIIESDVRAAALAEAHFGAGRDYLDFLYLEYRYWHQQLLGLRIARPHAGARGHALVLASAPTTALCPDCGRLHDTVLEDMAGGAGLVMRYDEKTGTVACGRA